MSANPPVPHLHLPVSELQRLALSSQRALGWGHGLLLALAGGTAALGGWAWAWQLEHGLVATGLNRPVGWGVLITNFVFWVGIAHAGTLASAVLYLFRARFRTAVYRVAEVMTLVAVMTAGLFPIIHLGRPWFAYWLLPLPNGRQLWANFHSPLVWDVFAISAYFVISALFLWMGLVPDLATLRDAGRGWSRRLHGVLALGWRGTDAEWRHHTRAYGLFAALAAPLVVSVSSVVAWDFAVALVPGWHSSLFPPYFVAGAVFSGVAMAVLLLIPVRSALGLEQVITVHHLDLLSRVVLLTGLAVSYAYATELLLAFRGPPSPLRALMIYRATGPYAPLGWLMVACNCGVPLLLFSRRVRSSPRALVPIMIAITVGMWLERFLIVVTSLAHERGAYDWGVYRPRWIEGAITAGAFGWFFFWFLLLLRLVPMVPLSELKEESARPEVARAR